MPESYDFAAISQRLEKLMRVKIKPNRVKSIYVNSSSHWQPRMTIEVGGWYANLESDSPREQVVAIFEATLFLVCTAERGLTSGMPYLFQRQDVREVKYYKE